MTIRNRECKVHVHALTRVCTYSGIISPCTCTKPAPRSVTNRNHQDLPVRGPSGRVIMSARRTPMPEEQIARDGCLSPWAAPVTGAPGWQITTRSRRLAVAAATILTGGTVHPHEKGGR